MGDPWGTHGARNTAPGGVGWQCMAPADTTTIHVIAGEGQIPPSHGERPQQDSNLRSRLRRPLLSPLSYGGYAPPKGYQPKGPRRTRGRTAS